MSVINPNHRRIDEATEAAAAPARRHEDAVCHGYLLDRHQGKGRIASTGTSGSLPSMRPTGATGAWSAPNDGGAGKWAVLACRTRANRVESRAMWTDLDTATRVGKEAVRAN
jgi:hypothetical protein